MDAWILALLSFSRLCISFSTEFIFPGGSASTLAFVTQILARL
jgi:hypothetical protein